MTTTTKNRIVNILLGAVGFLCGYWFNVCLFDVAGGHYIFGGKVDISLCFSLILALVILLALVKSRITAKQKSFLLGFFLGTIVFLCMIISLGISMGEYA